MSDASVITCTACRMRIVGTTERHDHYRSDLHRINLKRKVGGLGPLTPDEFHIRLSALQDSTDQTTKRRESTFCTACSKKFSSWQALENHNRSRRHLDRLKTLSQDKMSDFSTAGGSDMEGEYGDVGEVAEEREYVEDDDAVDRELERRMREGRPYSHLECVFDGSLHGSVEENLEYMAKMFGFFVPYVEEVVDVEGLLTYLGQKVGIGYSCVACDKAFVSVTAVQMHMIDKGHCRMTEDDGWEEEYGDFYTFGNEGWEEVEDDVENALVEAKDGSGFKESEGDGVGEEEVALAVGGKLLGHRSLRRYYKQAAGNRVDTRASVVANRIMKEYRLLGWEGGKVDAVLKRVQKKEAQRMKRFELAVGNKNYYTRKATFKQRMAVFNTGYRA